MCHKRLVLSEFNSSSKNDVSLRSFERRASAHSAGRAPSDPFQHKSSRTLRRGRWLIVRKAGDENRRWKGGTPVEGSRITCLLIAYG